MAASPLSDNARLLLVRSKSAAARLQVAIARIETHIHEMTQAGIQASARRIAASENPYASPQARPTERRRSPVAPAGWKRTFGFTLGVIAVMLFAGPALGIFLGIIVHPPKGWRWIEGAAHAAAPPYAIGVVCAVLAALLWRKRR